VNETQRDRLVYAIRVVAEAVKRDLAVDQPKGVVLYGRGLAPVELRWLVEGMEMVDVQPLALAGPNGEDREIVGYVLGRIFRIHVKRQRLAELNDVLHAPAGAR
jgi:hypothetical protein